MIFTVKRLADRLIEEFKCRLVADGNTRRYGVDFGRILSTVANLVVSAIYATRDYNLA